MHDAFLEPSADRPGVSDTKYLQLRTEQGFFDVFLIYCDGDIIPASTVFMDVNEVADTHKCPGKSCWTAGML